jgi:hypothetical protein
MVSRWIWKEAVMGFLKALSYNLPHETEENYQKPQGLDIY